MKLTFNESKYLHWKETSTKSMWPNSTQQSGALLYAYGELSQAAAYAQMARESEQRLEARYPALTQRQSVTAMIYEGIEDRAQFGIYNLLCKLYQGLYVVNGSDVTPKLMRRELLPPCALMGTVVRGRGRMYRRNFGLIYQVKQNIERAFCALC